MGFIASYKRLSRRSRLILGLVGIAIGLAGPYLVPSFPEPEKPEENIPLSEEVQKARPWWYKTWIMNCFLGCSPLDINQISVKSNVIGHWYLAKLTSIAPAPPRDCSSTVSRIEILNVRLCRGRKAKPKSNSTYMWWPGAGITPEQLYRNEWQPVKSP